MFEQANRSDGWLLANAFGTIRRRASFRHTLMDSIAEESSLIRCCIRLIDRRAFMR
jgi:hypothetical protein